MLGPTGGHDRLELAVAAVRKHIEDSNADEVIFDVFGFSRGAALARQFVNLINEWPAVISMPTLRESIWSPRPVIYWREIEAFPLGVKARVSFVGLFDTVGIFYIAGNERNLDFNLYLPSSSADRVVHLTAHHEIRRNFPLTSVKGPGGHGPAHFTEMVMPGVYSDIGGGYENPEKDFRNYEVFDLKAYAGHGSNWRTVQAAQRRIEAWNARDPRNIQPDVRGIDVYAVERRPTRKELAIYVLHTMYSFSESAGVPLGSMDQTQEEYRILWTSGWHWMTGKELVPIWIKPGITLANIFTHLTGKEAFPTVLPLRGVDRYSRIGRPETRMLSKRLLKAR